MHVHVHPVSVNAEDLQITSALFLSLTKITSYVLKAVYTVNCL